MQVRDDGAIVAPRPAVPASKFYANLPLRTEFGDVGRPESYTPLPDSWHVVMCDVRNSTAAVESGRYKSVNTLGAAVITGMLNAAGDTQIPFVFEGDGAMLCVPPELLDERARRAACARGSWRDKSFALDLRIATLPVARIREAGADILVGRFRVSENYVQAMFAGGGMAFADRYMKDPATAPLCRVEAGSVQPAGNFDGLECRWQDIPSRHGETVSVMVKVLVDDAGGGRPHLSRGRGQGARDLRRRRRLPSRLAAQPLVHVQRAPARQRGRRARGGARRVGPVALPDEDARHRAARLVPDPVRHPHRPRRTGAGTRPSSRAIRMSGSSTTASARSWRATPRSARRSRPGWTSASRGASWCTGRTSPTARR